jgi:ATP-dependent Clp protease adapter protein ClpS
VGIYIRDIAKTKAASAVERARGEGYPLKVEAIEE